jgi:hypothetical protein
VSGLCELRCNRTHLPPPPATSTAAGRYHLLFDTAAQRHEFEEDVINAQRRTRDAVYGSGDGVDAMGADEMSNIDRARARSMRETSLSRKPNAGMVDVMRRSHGRMVMGADGMSAIMEAAGDEEDDLRGMAAIASAADHGAAGGLTRGRSIMNAGSVRETVSAAPALPSARGNVASTRSRNPLFSAAALAAEAEGDVPGAVAASAAAAVPQGSLFGPVAGVGGAGSLFAAPATASGPSLFGAAPGPSLFGAVTGAPASTPAAAAGSLFPSATPAAVPAAPGGVGAGGGGGGGGGSVTRKSMTEPAPAAPAPAAAGTVTAAVAEDRAPATSLFGPVLTRAGPRGGAAGGGGGKADGKRGR